MHLKRQETPRLLPIPRKGTKYVARALTHHRDSVPVVVAVRDMLKLTKTLKEVKQMIKAKLLNLNGKEVKDHRESIRLFSIFKADKTYELTISPTHRFVLAETKDKKERLCKVIGKKVLKKSKTQLNLHDGSNVVTKDKININDSVYLDFSGKIKKSISLGKGKDVFILSGKYAGLKGSIISLKDRKLAKIKLKEKDVELPIVHIIVQ
jgi:small subunit ribosomal protein S4e